MSQVESEKKQPKSAYERDQVVEIINSVIAKVGEADESYRDTVFAELGSLKNVIDEVRSDLNQTGADDIKDKHIPTATDELDAVVEATAEATDAIMDACDTIQEKADEVGGEASEAIGNEVVKIYEACSFQDITGQRISKVVTTLHTIEEKVNKLIDALGGSIGGVASAGQASGASSEEEDDQGGEAGLLNGPQMADQAIAQDDIDKLLAAFD